MKLEELITKIITEFINTDINNELNTLDFMSKIEIVRKRLIDQANKDPVSFRIDNNPHYFEYELFFESKPDDLVKVKGWIPIDLNKITNSEKIDECVASGILRKIEGTAA